VFTVKELLVLGIFVFALAIVDRLDRAVGAESLRPNAVVWKEV